MYGPRKSKGAIIKVPILSGNKDTQEAVIPVAEKKKLYCLACNAKGWTERWVAKDQIHTRLQCNVCMGTGFVRRMPREIVSIAPVPIPATPPTTTPADTA